MICGCGYDLLHSSDAASMPMCNIVYTVTDTTSIPIAVATSTSRIRIRRPRLRFCDPLYVVVRLLSSLFITSVLRPRYRGTRIKSTHFNSQCYSSSSFSIKDTHNPSPSFVSIHLLLFFFTFFLFLCEFSFYLPRLFLGPPSSLCILPFLYVQPIKSLHFSCL